MNWYKKLKFREWIIKEAESEEHHRLRGRLSDWAIARGYPEGQSAFESGVEPDVLRLRTDEALLFVGDAKTVATEPASRAATRRRLEQYFREFADALGAGRIKGGTLAVATNDAAGATEWAAELNAMAADHGIVGGDGAPPAFRVEVLDAQTHIVFW